MPMKLASVKAMGIMMSCTYWLQKGFGMRICRDNTYVLTLSRSSHIANKAYSMLASSATLSAYRLALTVKSGIFTDNVAYIPRALLSALSHAQETLLPDSCACCPNRPSDVGTLMTAQMSIASQAAGTINAFTKKSQRMRWGETNMNGN